jgi:hypothetical protein
VNKPVNKIEKNVDGPTQMSRPRFSGKAGDQAAGRPAKPRTKDEDDDEGRWEGKSEEAIQEYIHDFDV